MVTVSKTYSYLGTLIHNKCPRCRQGDLFVSTKAYNFKNGENVQMHPKCPVCGQPTEIEVGFYYGTSYVSYALTVAFSVATFIAWWVIIGFGLEDNRVWWFLGVNGVLLIVLQPLLMRLSRTLWLSWFVSFNKNWMNDKPENLERINKDQGSNW